MIHRALVYTAITILACSSGLAQAAEPAQNAHKAYEQKLRDCRTRAVEQQRTGEELRSFVAACMKKPA